MQVAQKLKRLKNMGESFISHKSREFIHRSIYKDLSSSEYDMKQDFGVVTLNLKYKKKKKRFFGCPEATILFISAFRIK